MTNTLKSGATVDLAARSDAPIHVCVGWAHRAGSPHFCVDVNAFVCDGDRLVMSAAHFVFIDNAASPEGAVVLSNATTGASTNDGGEVVVSLDRTDTDAVFVVLALVVDDPTVATNSFDYLENVCVRLVGAADDAEFLRFDVPDNRDGLSAMVLVEIYRRGNEWKVRAVGQGYSDGTDGLARDYGVPM